MLKILFVIDFYKNPQAGTEGQLYKLISGLVSNGHVVHLLVFGESPYIASGEFPCAVTVLGRTSLKSPRMWLDLFLCALRFRRDGFKLAHVFFNDPSLICPPVFHLLGIETLISRRDMGFWYTPFQKAWLRLNARFLAGAVVNSNAVKEVTVSCEGIVPEKVHVIYNGYVAPNLVGDELLCPAEISDWKDAGRIIAVVVANLRPIKRLQDPIEALGMLREKVPSLCLLIVGEGDPASLNARAEALDVADRVRLIGGRANPVSYVRGCDVGLLCSESEGLSNSIIEYLQCGKPVICSNVGGNPELVTHGESGFLYEAGDVVALAEMLQKLASSAELRNRLGENAYQNAVNRFGTENMVKLHEELYLSLCSVS